MIPDKKCLGMTSITLSYYRLNLGHVYIVYIIYIYIHVGGRGSVRITRGRRFSESADNSHAARHDCCAPSDGFISRIFVKRASMSIGSIAFLCCF